MGRLLFTVKVEGESCWPDLVPGKRYFATSLLRPRVGDFIVFKRPSDLRSFLVKKVKEVRGDSYYVEGTVSWGTTSETLGLISHNSVLGRIVGR